ncbi:MAG TPA: 2-oxoglutarate dehydrogenase E1 component [Streptosporangiaceae bacterium]|nr:2-oxoglutarate dehydrogenase E1 component [Streptosporangiaceae bacterium]
MDLVADPAAARRIMAAAAALRTIGHLAAPVNPLPELDPPLEPSLVKQLEWLATDSFDEFAGLPAALTGGPLADDADDAQDALSRLRQIYLGPAGYEFGHLRDSARREWLEERVEARPGPPVPDALARSVLARLARTEGFERYLQRAFVGEKRFSLEGTDMIVPMLERVVELAHGDGFGTVVFGTVSRGRLNLIAQLFGADPGQLFAAFGKTADPVPLGDVKYHQGGETEYRPAPDGRPMRLVMLPNPSHLEFVTPVALGLARALQDGQPGDPGAALPVLTHGDAAFAGQGIVAESFNLTRLPGYVTGGTVHIMMNNQVGFTTDPADGRSTRYATDLARGFDIPVVHVNADDPEACIRAVELAYAYRMTFGADFMVDLVGYRRRGHQEVDDPSFTQPRQSQLIDAHPTVFSLYATALAARGVIAPGRGAELEAEVAEEFRAARDTHQPGPERYPGGTPGEPLPAPLATGVPADRLHALNQALAAIPSGFAAAAKLDRRVLDPRRQLGQVSWAHAESLAWGSLLQDGISVRVSGEDAERGTFAQRHAVWHDTTDGSTYTPLQHVPGAAGQFTIANSPLTETATLAFEYGYSIERPRSVSVWEAQFGDFANVAQPIIDQFVMAGSYRWGHHPSLVLLLPHGLEGQGAEHSSARPERFLQLAAENNAWIVNCSTAAQYFHALRQHALAPGPARPLIVFSPKRLLRDPAAASGADELTSGQFRPILTRVLGTPGPEPVRLLLYTGKIGAELAAAHETRAAGPVLLLSVEQLYPLPAAEIAAAIQAAPALAEVAWVQEEPENMGAWPSVKDALATAIGRPLRYLGRPARVVPAQGSSGYHQREQEALISAALATPTNEHEENA